MPLDLARRIGVALDVRSATRIRQIDQALKEYVRLTPQSPTVPSAGNIDAAQVISGTFDDDRVAESNVTQHEAALVIDWMQVVNEPATFPPSAHNHNASDLNAGTLADGRVAQSNVTQHQAALSLAATQLVSGVLANARVQESNVTQHEAALSIDWMQLTSIPSTFAPAAHLTWNTWTPTDVSGGGLSFATATGLYATHEDLAIVMGRVTYPATADGNNAVISLPFTLNGADANRIGVVTYTSEATAIHVSPIPGNAIMGIYTAAGAGISNAAMSGDTIYFACIYRKT